MKSKKGFTMVELLATIAIIAVLTTLAIVGVSGVRNALKNSYYKRVEKLVVAAGMEYYNDHKSKRPFRTGQSDKVALSVLQNEDYIEEVKDYKKAICDPNSGEIDADKSYVVIIKKSTKKYEYQAYLNCPNYRDGTPTDSSPTPDVGPGETITCKNMLNASSAGWTNTNVELIATKPNEVASYEIQKQNGSNWETIGSEYNTDKSITISTTGITHYRAVGRGSDGSYCTSDPVEVKIDKTAPSGLKVNLYKWKDIDTKPTSPSGLDTYTNNTWFNGKVYTIASGATDSGSGGVYYQYTTTGTTANSTNAKAPSRSIETQGVSHIKYRACDAAGNCSAYSTNYGIKLDRTAPKCETATGTSTTWTNSSRTISQPCTDSYSGCVKDTYSKTFSNTKTGSITITDKVGISKNCSVNVYSDTTAPTCGTATGTSTTWTKSSRTITQPCTDNLSGCDSVSKTYSSTTKTASVSVTDGAGNSTACSAYNVYVDTTAPSGLKVNLYKWKNADTKPTSSSGLSAYSNNTWFNGKVYTVASGATDSHSGGVYYQYTTTGTTTNNTNTTSSTRNIEANGTSYIKYRACDAVGNCSGYSTNYTIKLDRTAPQIKFCKSQKSASVKACEHNTYCVRIYYHDAYSGLGVRGASDLKWKVGGGSENTVGWKYDFPGNNGMDEIAHSNTNIVITYTKIVDEVGLTKTVTADQKYSSLSQCPKEFSW